MMSVPCGARDARVRGFSAVIIRAHYHGSLSVCVNCCAIDAVWSLGVSIHSEGSVERRLSNWNLLSGAALPAIRRICQQPYTWPRKTLIQARCPTRDRRGAIVNQLVSLDWL